MPKQKSRTRFAPSPSGLLHLGHAYSALFAEKEAKDSVALEIGEARADAAKLIERTNKELEAQKSTALAQLETQVDELSQLIKEKLLGKEVVL